MRARFAVAPIVGDRRVTHLWFLRGKRLLVPSYLNCHPDNIQVVKEGKGSYYTRLRPLTTIVGAVPGNILSVTVIGIFYSVK